MALNNHSLGTVVKVTGTFRDPENANALYDPDAVSIIVTDPNGEHETYVYQTDDELTRDSEGIYDALIPGTIPGHWSGRYNGDDVAFEEHDWLIDAARGVPLTGIYAKLVPSSRVLKLSDRQDPNEAEISGPIRMKAGEKYTWRIDFSQSHLSRTDLVDGISAPVVGGTQAANCTINASEGTGWGVAPDGEAVLVELAINAEATSDDEIYITITAEPEPGDEFIQRVPVDVIAVS